MRTMFKQPLVLSSVLWLGMAIAGATVSSDRAGEQAVATAGQPGEMVTIVGCLVQGDPALLGSDRTEAVSSAAPVDYFVRTPAIQVPVGTTVTVGGSDSRTGARGGGVTTSAGAPDKTALYRVMGLDRNELRQHLGHRVEVQGRLRADDTALGVSVKTTVAAGGRPTTTVEERLDLAGALDATAITMVSESCQ